MYVHAWARPDAGSGDFGKGTPTGVDATPRMATPTLLVLANSLHYLLGQLPELTATAQSL
jgi:hypothetical protein